MPVTANDFLDASRSAKQLLVDLARTSGPMYQGKSPTPLVWWDQYFVKEATPSGTINSDVALRVGGTQSAIDVVVVASHSNATDITVASGASIKLELLQCDTEDGTFEAYGPSMTVTAPADGIVAGKDRQVVRFVIGNTEKPWVKAKLTVTGNVTGGKVDVALAYTPR